MWRSQTLPRPKPSVLPPLPPHRGTGTMNRSNRDVDVKRLREDIEMLSRQLNMVKAQLDSQLSEDNGPEEQQNQSHDTVDSRLSTVLFSPISTRSRDTPTPQPTHLNIPIDSFTASAVSTLRKNSQSMSTSFLSTTTTVRSNLSQSRMSICVPSTYIVVPRVKRRETFSKADESDSRSTIRSIRRTVSESQNSLAPPKPSRTFAEKLDRTLQRRAILKEQDNTNQYLMSNICSVPDCDDEQMASMMKERFNRGQCWFSRIGEVFFVNPFSDISSTKHASYRAVSTITASLIQHRNAALVFRGVSGSGKSHLCELVCLEVVERLSLRGETSTKLSAALVALRPFLSVNTRSNNQCSRAVHHYELRIREGRLRGISLRHFLVESASRGCRGNVFAMLANDLSEKDKERFRISGFQLRDNYINYGNLDDFTSALTTLGVNAVDVFTVLCACTLLNNLVFKEIKGFVDIENLSDLEDASYLLGLSSLSLYRTIMNGTLSDPSIIESQRVRDDLVSAIYSRVVSMVLRKANEMLETGEEPENESCFNDSGIGLGTSDRSIIHIIDIPGYVRSTSNSLSELLVNTINDNMDGRNRESVTKLLQNIDLANQMGTERINRTLIPISHCDGNFPVEYDSGKLSNRNRNFICRELVLLFDSRSCSSRFIAKLFAADVRMLRDDCDMQPRAVNWTTQHATVLQNVLESVRLMNAAIAHCDKQFIHCLKSNERLEFARISESGIVEQLKLFEGMSSRPGSTISLQFSSREARPPSQVFDQQVQTAPVLPPPRAYEVKDGKKHLFPQRRNIIVDFVDQSSGVSLRAGEVVKATGFSGECYLIETGRRQKAAVPISFTEKSLPPTEAYCV